MFSKYLRTRERDGMVAVFHELHPDPVYITADDWSAYCSGEILNNLLDSQLRERKLVISEMSDDDRAFATAESLVLGKLQHTTILYLMTAQGCNADCGYCPVQDIAKRYGASLLTVEAARAGIDLWQLHLEDVFDDNRDYYVIFYGGEPLLNKPVIEESLRYLESQKISGKLPKRVQYMVATNGLLIDDEFVRLCLEYRMSVAVGLDGDARANDALKIDIAGQPTFSRITEAVRKLVTAGISTHASCSITPFNFEQVEEMSDLFRNIGVRKFGFNFLRGQKLVELVGQDGVESYYRQASKAIIRHARVQSEPGFEFQMEKKLWHTHGETFSRLIAHATAVSWSFSLTARCPIAPSSRHALGMSKSWELIFGLVTSRLFKNGAAACRSTIRMMRKHCLEEVAHGEWSIRISIHR